MLGTILHVGSSAQLPQRLLQSARLQLATQTAAELSAAQLEAVTAQLKLHACSHSITHSTNCINETHELIIDFVQGLQATTATAAAASNTSAAAWLLPGGQSCVSPARAAPAGSPIMASDPFSSHA